jgi:urease accessory protein UreF
VLGPDLHYTPAPAAAVALAPVPPQAPHTAAVVAVVKTPGRDTAAAGSQSANMAPGAESAALDSLQASTAAAAEGEESRRESRDVGSVLRAAAAAVHNFPAVLVVAAGSPAVAHIEVAHTLAAAARDRRKSRCR